MLYLIDLFLLKLVLIHFFQQIPFDLMSPPRLFVEVTEHLLDFNVLTVFVSHSSNSMSWQLLPDEKIGKKYIF